MHAGGPSLLTLRSKPLLLGTEKVPQRNCVTNVLPNVRVNFLGRIASKPLFYWVMTGNPLELFRKLFGAVRAMFWLCESFFDSCPLAHLQVTCQVTCTIEAENIT